MKNEVGIIIVSYNRKDFVLKNIQAVRNLANKAYDLFVFDNGSSDGTIDAVKKSDAGVEIIVSEKNLGGAGGFAAGMKHLYERGYSYIWCLDDDGYPDKNALDALLQEAALNKDTILGTRILAVDGNEKQRLFWPMNGKYDRAQKNTVELSDEEKESLLRSGQAFETTSVALLGMFIPGPVIKKIGYPKSELFISNDDVEYCLRAWTNGLRVKLVQQAIVYHPANRVSSVRFFSRRLEFILMPPGRLYYYIRNNIFVTRIYYPFSKLLRLCCFFLILIFYSVLSEKHRLLIIKNGILGFYHGFIGRLGKYDA